MKVRHPCQTGVRQSGFFPFQRSHKKKEIIDKSKQLQHILQNGKQTNLTACHINQSIFSSKPYGEWLWMSETSNQTTKNNIKNRKQKQRKPPKKTKRKNRKQNNDANISKNTITYIVYSIEYLSINSWALLIFLWSVVSCRNSNFNISGKWNNFWCISLFIMLVHTPRSIPHCTSL